MLGELHGSMLNGTYAQSTWCKDNEILGTLFTLDLTCDILTFHKQGNYRFLWDELSKND